MNSLGGRILLALLILIFDAAIFFIPLGAFFIVYVILARPPWSKEWVERLYRYD